jgi:hypothetical protein
MNLRRKILLFLALLGLGLPILASDMHLFFMPGFTISWSNRAHGATITPHVSFGTNPVSESLQLRGMVGVTLPFSRQEAGGCQAMLFAEFQAGTYFVLGGAGLALVKVAGEPLCLCPTLSFQAGAGAFFSQRFVLTADKPISNTGFLIEPTLPLFILYLFDPHFF